MSSRVVRRARCLDSSRVLQAAADNLEKKKIVRVIPPHKTVLKNHLIHTKYKYIFRPPSHFVELRLGTWPRGAAYAR